MMPTDNITSKTADKSNTTTFTTNLSTSTTGSSVYINPKFKNAHINPNFLPKNPLQSHPQPNQIYINPKFKNAHINPIFLNKNSASKTPVTAAAAVVIKSNDDLPPKIRIPTGTPLSELTSIVTKTPRKIVRQSVPLSPTVMQKSPNKVQQIVASSVPVHLLKVGERKLIRASHVKSSTLNPQPKKVENIKKSIHTTYKIVKGNDTPENRYKIDRRLMRSSSLTKMRTPYKSVYRSGSGGLNETLSMHKVIITNRKLLRIGVSSDRQSSSSTSSTYKPISIKSNHNRKLEMLNINGVFYKSTKTKLQKQDATPTKSIVKPLPTGFKRLRTTSRTLFVRGDKFLLNPNGNKLTRISSTISAGVSAGSLMKRIDIGGLTYRITNKSSDTYERTDTHRTRIHLTAAKQKSIRQLAQNRVKSNVPCVIYQKLGKCHGKERGRCPKIHDTRNVAICQKFLKGTCDADKCLLSHNVTLSKMPTCKFFLQGICAKTDCPYLHKKVNEKMEICLPFLQGFCEQAEKCNKRHEFLCPDMESKGKCERTRCPYPHKGKLADRKDDRKFVKNSSVKKVAVKESTEQLNDTSSAITAQSIERTRYFDDTDNNITSSDDTTSTIDNQAKLSQILHKIDKMKANLNFCTGNNNAEVNASSSNNFPLDRINLTHDTSQHSEEDTTAEKNEEEIIATPPRPKRPKLGKLPSYIPLD